MTYHDLIEIVEYLDYSRKDQPNYQPTEADQQRQLLDFLKNQQAP